jgi:hypothetical protein
VPSEGLDGAIREPHSPLAVIRFGWPHEDLTTVPR